MRTALALLLTIPALLSGCTGGENRVEEGNREGVLFLGNGSEPQTVDPQEARRLLAEAPLIPIATYTGKRLVQPSVTGMHGRIVSGYHYKYVSFDPNASARRWQDPEP